MIKMLTFEEVLEHWPVLEPMIKQPIADVEGMHSIDAFMDLQQGTQTMWVRMNDMGEITFMFTLSVEHSYRSKTLICNLSCGKDLRGTMKEAKPTLLAHSFRNGFEGKPIKFLGIRGIEKLVPDTTFHRAIASMSLGENE